MRRIMNLNLTKLMVSLSRKWRRTNHHTPLKEQLAINRGKALGMPYKFPDTRYQQRIAEKRHQRWLERMKVSF